VEQEKAQLNFKKEITMSAGEANLYALIFLVPVILAIAVPYYYLWPEQFSKTSIRAYLDAREMMNFTDLVAIGLVILAGIIIHELLHGIGWSLYAKKGWRSIKFGIVWKYLTPYCHCNEPIHLNPYRIGSILPAIILGIFPSIVAFATGNIWFMVFGFFFTFAAGGDFLILWLLRNEKSTLLVQDHPEKIGCIILQEE